MKESIVIVGAGAAGLMCALQLSKRKHQVTLIEAQPHIGGRMHTISEAGFYQPVETGAEFIHGNLPLSLKLVKKAGLAYTLVEGEMVSVNDGIVSEDESDDGWDKLLRKMKQLAHDMTMKDFLAKYFSKEKYAGLRNYAERFASGFDLADINKASVFALRDEWMNEDDEQYRITGGYQKLIEYFVTELAKHNVDIITGCAIKSIKWKKGKVMLTGSEGKTFSAAKVIITASLGVMQNGDIEFSPAIPEHYTAFCNIGFGNVIKFLFQFKSPFWQQLHAKTGFIFSGEEVPTWWTQYPNDNGLLTGWLGGTMAEKHQHKTDEELLLLALQSLGNIFNIGVADLRDKLTANCIINWLHQPHMHGGYSYSLPQSIEAKKLLSKPINNTIYFAGEALYIGQDAGTVEAALTSGKKTAQKVMND